VFTAWRTWWSLNTLQEHTIISENSAAGRLTGTYCAFRYWLFCAKSKKFVLYICSNLLINWNNFAAQQMRRAPIALPHEKIKEKGAVRRRLR
jgi:hypothetical protein